MGRDEIMRELKYKPNEIMHSIAYIPTPDSIPAVAEEVRSVVCVS